MAEVSFTNVTKEFPGGAIAVDDLSLTATDGEFLILVGPSGCGKTTALRLLAGLEQPTSGEIRIGDEVVNDVQPRNRDIAMVFQNYALYPHMNVEKNLAFGLKQRNVPAPEIARRIGDIAETLGLDELMKRKPGQLSGGQRQRVAMGRALVREPRALLMDEPLSNLDAKLRLEMRAELKRLHARIATTTIYVTHDQVEAMTLGDHIAVMSLGKVQQLGPPQEVYDHPANVFVAGFIGSPPMNLLEASSSAGVITAGDVRIERPGTPDGSLIIGIRPEQLHASPQAPAGEATGPSLTMTVEVVEPLGDEVMVHGTTPGRNAVMEGLDIDARAAADEGDAETIARLDPRTKVSRGDQIRLSVEGTIHYFDLQSGLAIK
jgi:sn-glycerol 3-phosphate transport system ATP-binding protein